MVQVLIGVGVVLYGVGWPAMSEARQLSLMPQDITYPPPSYEDWSRMLLEAEKERRASERGRLVFGALSAIGGTMFVRDLRVRGPRCFVGMTLLVIDGIAASVSHETINDSSQRVHNLRRLGSTRKYPAAQPQPVRRSQLVENVRRWATRLTLGGAVVTALGGAMLARHRRLTEDDPLGPGAGVFFAGYMTATFSSMIWRISR